MLWKNRDQENLGEQKKEGVRSPGTLTDSVRNTTVRFTRADTFVQNCVCALADHVEAGHALQSAGGEFGFNVATCIPWSWFQHESVTCLLLGP